MVISATRSPFRRLFVDAFLPAMILITAGCGGGEEEAASDSAAPAAAAPAGDPAAMAAPGMAGTPGMMPGMMGAGATDSSGGATAASSPAGPGPGMEGMAGYPGMGSAEAGMAGTGAAGLSQPQVPRRPDNVAMWTDEQLIDAVHDRDPKLLDAIDSRVTASPGDPKVAEMLTSLLTALANPRVSTQSNPQGGAAGYPGAPSSEYPANYPGTNGSSATPGMAPGVAPGVTPNAGAETSAGPGISSPQSSVPAETQSIQSTATSALQATPPMHSAIQTRMNQDLAIDSISMMFLETATAYYPGGAVRAMSEKNIPGAVGAGSSEENSAAPGTQNSSGGAISSGAMSGYTGAAGASYPGSEYPGGEAGMQGAPGQGKGGLPEPLLVERIVDGLIKNGSPAAWQTIYGIAAQTVKTPLPPGAGAEIVTHGLFRNIDSNPTMIEPILLSLIDGSAQLPPESRLAALNVTAQISGLAADKLTGLQGMPSAAVGNGFAGAGAGMAGQPMASYPGAAGMQSGAGVASVYPGAGGAEGDAGMSSGAAPGGGMPGATPGGSNPLGKPLLSDAALMRAASFLWGPKCIDALVKQLDASTDIGIIPGFVSGGDFVRIAASVPNDRVRKALANLFEKSAPASVAPLGIAGFFSSSVHDPGMLISLKSLPRAKPSRIEAAQGVPMDAWSTASLDVVLSLRDRLRALSAIPGKLTPVTENLPIRLHKNAVTEFYGVLTLPGPAGSALKESAPSATKIYYARTSFTPEKPKDQQDLAEHYESRATGIKRASEAKGVLLWVDGFKATQTGSKRTADVLVSSSTGGAGGAGAAAGAYGESGGAGGPGGYGAAAAAGGASGAFKIEIIVVETGDAKAPAAADAKDGTAAKK